ncbi:MAG: PQQ-binding-like beta-propeller repeat protein [Pirellulales bacterium]|nr:PQQ-binding-like beta-propeller repeat protein [Pirellulales bacterium]
MHLPTSLALLLLTFLTTALPAATEPEAQWGNSPTRNNVSSARGIPIEWNIGRIDPKTHEWDKKSAKNVRWVARLGTQTYGTPIVAGNRVFCATNNGAGYLKKFPAKVDLGCLLCFDRRSGKFLWQHSVPKHSAGDAVDWEQQGICSSPLVQGDRLWLVTNRGEVVCLDTKGNSDAPGESRVVWRFDMMRQLGVVPHNMSSCSVTAAGDLLLVNTSNGTDGSRRGAVPAPKAPSFIALDKTSGKLVWSDASPGENLLHGQWSSPAFTVLGGVPQAVFAGGDGWVYSFEATRGADRKPKLLWKFDCNPKDSLWEGDGMGERANLIAAPVIADGRVFVVTGHDPEFGEANGRIWCINPTRRGDVSPTLVVDRQGKPVPPRRLSAVDSAAGEKVRPNPNSAAVWQYTGHDANADGQLDFEETMHRSLGMVAVKDNLLFVGDLTGLVHCLDARSGKPHWTYDMMAAVWGSPLIVEDRVYLGDEDGDVAVFALSPQHKLLAENNLGTAVYTAPVAAGSTLFISTRTHLFAIATDSAENRDGDMK